MPPRGSYYTKKQPPLFFLRRKFFFEKINHSGFFIHFFDTYRRNFHDDSAPVRKATLESVILSKECFSYHNNVVHILPHCLHLMVDSNSAVREQCHTTFRIISDYILSQPFEPLREELRPLRPWDMPDIFKRSATRFMGGQLLLSDGVVDPALDVDQFEYQKVKKGSTDKSASSNEQIKYEVPKDEKGKKEDAPPEESNSSGTPSSPVKRPEPPTELSPQRPKDTN